MSTVLVRRLDPVNHIVWARAEELKPNLYNPNVVFGPEMTLLERSILEQGWTAPVLVHRGSLIIIDGFHRVVLALHSPLVLKKYNGIVPTAGLEVDLPTAMLITIRMNRAKGSHVAAKMSAIVHELIDVHNLDRQELAREIGATLDEIDLLYQDDVFTAKKIPEWSFSKAWYPVEKPRLEE